MTAPIVSPLSRVPIDTQWVEFTTIYHGDDPMRLFLDKEPGTLWERLAERAS